MRIAVTGAGGLLGTAVMRSARAAGHEMLAAHRTAHTDSDLLWSVRQGIVEPRRWEGLDAVIHLAGENIASRRWSAKQKELIRSSRVDGTRRLAESLAKLAEPPANFIAASAIGYYGCRDDEELTEGSESGSGFLAEVCREWERASDPLRETGTRVVRLRIGMVLAREGGALPKMLPPFRAGLGGVVGNGRQYWSWVSIDDAAGAFMHVLGKPQLDGPLNAVAPEPATNAEFTRALGRVLHRPTLVPLPAFAARLLLGEMADELLLCSARVLPRRLEESGYVFRHRQLEPALRDMLSR